VLKKAKGCCSKRQISRPSWFQLYICKN